MNFINKFLIIVLLLICQIIKAQPVDSEKIIKNINREVIHFLIQKNELQKGQAEEKYLEQITIIELLQRESLGHSKNGIYMFRALFAPNTTFLFLKKDAKIKILDPYYFSKTIKDVLIFLKKQNTTNNDIIKYTEEVIKIYKMNNYDSKYRL